MKKFSIYSLLVATAFCFAACNDDYKDWAEPQSNPQADDATVTFTAQNVGCIDLRDGSKTEVQIFNPTITANSENATTTYVATIYNADKTDSRTVEVAEGGIAQRTDLTGVMTSLYGTTEVERQAPMDVTAYTQIDGTAIVNKVEGLIFTAIPKFVEMPKIWYVLGNCIGKGTWYNRKSGLGGDGKFVSLVAMYPNPENLEQLVYGAYLPKGGEFRILVMPYSDYPCISGGSENGGQSYYTEKPAEGLPNIVIENEGYYKIVVNIADKTNPTVKFTKLGPADYVAAQMAMPGSYQNPSWDVTGNLMTKVTTAASGENHDWFADVTFGDDASSEGGVKFASDGNWANPNWGGPMFPLGTASKGGPNIPYTAGTYRVIFNDLLGIYYFFDKNSQYDELPVE